MESLRRTYRYVWLEEPKAEATKSFVENQVQLTKSVLSTCDTEEKLRERITASYDYPKFSISATVRAMGVSAMQYQLPHPDPDLFKEYSVCGTSGVHCANVGKVLEGLIDSKELHNGRGNVHFQEGNLLTTSYFLVKDGILQSETEVCWRDVIREPKVSRPGPEYVCVDTKASKSIYCNLQKSLKEGVMPFNTRSIGGVAKAILTVALILITTPMVGGISPEAATAQGTLEAGKFEKSFNLGTGVVGIIGVVVTTVGVGVAINECRRKQRAITPLSSTAPIGNMVNRAGKLLQTHIVKRWRISDMLHYEYVQRSEELV